MTVQLTNPELLKYIDEEVKAGHYPTADAAVEACVAMVMFEQDDIDDDTLAAINRADDQYDRGEFVEWDDVRDGLREKYLGK